MRDLFVEENEDEDFTVDSSLNKNRERKSYIRVDIFMFVEEMLESNIS